MKNLKSIEIISQSSLRITIIKRSFRIDADLDTQHEQRFIYNMNKKA